MADLVNFPDRDSPFENNMLRGELIIDAWLVLRSHLSPEHFITLELERVRAEMLEQFYRRFPDQRPTGDSHAT